MAKQSILEIILKATDQTKRGISSATSGFKGFAAQLTTVQGALGALGLTAGMVKVLDWAQDSIDKAKEQIRVETQLDAVLRSTGHAAGMSADEVKRLASELQGVTNFGDEATIAGQNLLLTFTNIGRDIFPQATMTMLDMSAALDQGLKESAIQLGKALNDPIQGVSALQRVGVSFSAEQKKVIESLVQTGKSAEAQKLILEELSREFGGSAEAAREADAGYQAAANALGDLQEVIGMRLLPTMRSFNELVIESANGWITALNAVGTIQDVNSRVAEKLGMDSERLALARKYGTVTEEQYQAALAKVNEEMQEASNKMAAEAQMAQRTEFYNRVLSMTLDQAAENVAQLNEEEQKLIDTLGRAGAAAAARGKGLAAYYRPPGKLRNTPMELMQEQEAAALEAEKQQEDYQSKLVSGFSEAADQMANVISSAIRPTLQEVWQPPQDTSRIDEWARRMATLSTEGLSSEWIGQLQQQFGGETFFQPIADAISQGDDTALREAANNILTTKVTELWDKELIKQKVREQLQQQNLREELIKEIQQELGAEGVATSVGVIASAAGDVTMAQDEVKTGLEDMATVAQTTGQQMGDGFSQAVTQVEILNARISLLNELLGTTRDSAAIAAANIAGLNPPAAGPVANADARAKAGPVPPL